MCYQTQAIVLAMNQDAGKDLTVMTVDGGVSDSDLCMQTQADIIGIPVERPAMRETTALGAAIVAGLAVGAWKGTKELEGWRGRGNDVFKPAISDKERIKMFRRWEKAVEMSKGWTFTEDELAAEDKEIEEQVEEDSKNKEEAEKKAAELEREKAEEKGEMRDGVPEISHPEEGRKSRRKSGLHPQRPISLGNLGRIESGVEGYEE
jgi:glycerol kinase